jgi:hypothetical protein
MPWQTPARNADGDVFRGDDGRLVYTLDDPDAAIIRAELSAEWTPAELSRLCRKLGAMRDGQLKGFVQKITGGCKYEQGIDDGRHAHERRAAGRDLRIAKRAGLDRDALHDVVWARDGAGQHRGSDGGRSRR